MIDIYKKSGGIAFAGADDGTLYLNLIPLPSHVLLPRCEDMKNKIAIDRTTVGIYDLRLLRGKGTRVGIRIVLNYLFLKKR